MKKLYVLLGLVVLSVGVSGCNKENSNETPEITPTTVGYRRGRERYCNKRGFNRLTIKYR